MNTLRIIKILLITWVFASCSPEQQVDDRPNIIFIMVDDMGFADLSSYGRTDYETPRIDALISEGIKFTNAYSAAAVCTPTRVALMTGKYPARTEVGLYEPITGGSEEPSDLGLSPKIPTISSMIKQAGYATALFGKWHLGRSPQHLPNKHGFDSFFGITAGSADYIDHEHHTIEELILYENDKPVEREGYLTNLITDNAIDFIRKKHDRPFFISLQYTSPHWPWQIPGDDPYPDGVNFRQGGSPEIFAGMVKNLDANIGRVLDFLAKNGLEESTLVIFTSDHGGVQFSDMGPFKGKKATLFEGGIRVPATARWPGVISPHTVSEQVVITMDWTVTMLDIAQINTTEDFAFDGISLLSHFKDSRSITPRQLFWRTSNWSLQDAYRSENWKYLKNDDGEFLFDLENDPGEIENLRDSNPLKFDQLKNEFQQLDEQMLDRLILN
ncbi:MAG: sulfatase-like hydrolase/transferase [Flavobacteriaceae bacterium]